MVMKKITINTVEVAKSQIDLIIRYLNQGKVIAYPTDTIYGLGCDATREAAIKKIFRIKQRGKDCPLLILVSSFSMLKKYCLVSNKQVEYLKKVWSKSSKPTTVILKSRGILPRVLTGGQDSVAVRMPTDLPKNDFLIKIIRYTGKPIVSTSLNISGRKNLKDIKMIDKYFKVRPDLVVDGGELKSRASRIVDVREVENVKIIR